VERDSLGLCTFSRAPILATIPLAARWPTVDDTTTLEEYFSKISLRSLTGLRGRAGELSAELGFEARMGVRGGTGTDEAMLVEDPGRGCEGVVGWRLGEARGSWSGGGTIVRGFGVVLARLAFGVASSSISSASWTGGTSLPLPLRLACDGRDGEIPARTMGDLAVLEAKDLTGRIIPDALKDLAARGAPSVAMAVSSSHSTSAPPPRLALAIDDT
jgi:hypothetical protein